MSDSFLSLAYHIVFSTKFRKRMLSNPIRDETFKYIRGITAKMGGQLVEIGGVEDHVHLLASCSPRMALADFVREIKSNSSKWLRQQKKQKSFNWQSGYAAFTVSSSQVATVRKYIRGQEEHHRKLSFEEEFRAILVRHGISFDEKYLFDDEPER